MCPKRPSIDSTHEVGREPLYSATSAVIQQLWRISTIESTEGDIIDVRCSRCVGLAPRNRGQFTASRPAFILRAPNGETTHLQARPAGPIRVHRHLPWTPDQAQDQPAPSPVCPWQPRSHAASRSRRTRRRIRGRPCRREVTHKTSGRVLRRRLRWPQNRNAVLAVLDGVFGRFC